MSPTTAYIIRVLIYAGIEAHSLLRAASEILAFDREELESRISLAEKAIDSEIEKILTRGEREE
jgi:hypothetical protein